MRVPAFALQRPLLSVLRGFNSAKPDPDPQERIHFGSLTLKNGGAATIAHLASPVTIAQLFGQVYEVNKYTTLFARGLAVGARQTLAAGFEEMRPYARDSCS